MRMEVEVVQGLHTVGPYNFSGSPAGRCGRQEKIGAEGLDDGTTM